MADTGGPPQQPGLEARVARLESDVAHMRGDVAEIKSTLSRLAPRIDEMHGFLTAKLPELATKAELVESRGDTKAEFASLRAQTKAEFADLQAETKGEFADVRRGMAELRIEIMQRPTRRQSIFDIFVVVGLIGAVLTIASRFAHWFLIQRPERSPRNSRIRPIWRSSVRQPSPAAADCAAPFVHGVIVV